MDDLRRLIRTIPDFPKPGIQFRDVTTLLGDAEGFRRAIEALAERYGSRALTSATTSHERVVDKVAGVEARGFILGGALAHRLGTGFVPLRKKGKLPGETLGQDYALEYGTDRIELHVGAIAPGERVLVVDDLLATGGTAEAAIRLVEAARGVVVEACFLVDLPELGGGAKLRGLGHSVFSLVDFEGH
jgi:adenine phosphoribosyltransferase